MSFSIKGLIPCAGLGTRLHPLTHVIPKELLPIGTTPAIYFHVKDLLEADIRDVIIVVNDSKSIIGDYLRVTFPEIRFIRLEVSPPMTFS